MSYPPLLTPGGGSKSRQQQVSLRGASAREMSRDALLRKVSEEREVRNLARRTSAAALFIQRVWRRYHFMKLVVEQHQEEWEKNLNCHNFAEDTWWICNNLLRPFLFFITHATKACQKLKARDIRCTRLCFEKLLQSITSPDPAKNFCSMATSISSERVTWLYQTEKLASLCLFLLAESNATCHISEDAVLVTSMGLRLLISLIDLLPWKCIGMQNATQSTEMVMQNATQSTEMVKKILLYMATGRISLYNCVRKYILELANGNSVTDNKFFITTSAVTLMLRPFLAMKLGAGLSDSEMMHAAEDYCKIVLTIPYLLQRLPAVLLPALRHESSVLPCLQVLLVAREKVLPALWNISSKDSARAVDGIDCIGWLLSNVVNLSIEGNDSERFIEGLDHKLYVQVIGCLADCFLNWFDNVDTMKMDHDAKSGRMDISLDSTFDTEVKLMLPGTEKASFTNQLEPIYQQWHLRLLLDAVKENLKGEVRSVSSITSGNLELLDVILAYSNMLRVYKGLNSAVGCFHFLNMLSFTPEFLPALWKALEGYFFGVDLGGLKNSNPELAHHLKNNDQMAIKKAKSVLKDAGDKWVHVFLRIVGRSSDMEFSVSSEDPCKHHQAADGTSCPWEIKSKIHGYQDIPKEILSSLHLFCAVYAHLLLVLDDLEFYEKQVPFTLVQQQMISSLLNHLVYSSFISSDLNSKALTEEAIRCLHFLYERDCRRRFCPISLWLEPAKNGRIPVVAAARAHEVAFSNIHHGDTTAPMCSIITKMPHVFPFEERVQMFREFINLDKIARRAAGEADGRCLGSMEIIIRRNNIVEDGFRQLNSLGSKLKSNFNVSFVSECGLPEAGLDYGGLSKEFLTDLAKSAFDPLYGLFLQSCTPERFLFPNAAAKYMDNGLDMIEFLGRIVGKALYEGILLDYSFSLAFIQKLLGRYSYLDELSTLDPELYKNLMYVKHYDGDVEELSLDFTVTEEIFGKCVLTELKPGGKNITVSNDNKLQYVYAMSDYKLNLQILPLASAFFRGLSDLIAPSWLRLFNGSEFNQLLSGGKHDFDIEDLKKHTRYTGGYSGESRTIKLFWEAVRGFTPEERCLLLKFVTSCSRGPLLGFKHLQPMFTIHKVVCDVPLLALIGGQDVDRLPSASTCYNTLKLPTYKKASTMKNKLLYAICSNTGFELS